MNLICLDLDGTLEDSRADMVAVARRVRKGLKLPARPDEQLRPWVNKGMEQLYRACFDDYIKGDPERLSEVLQRYEADYYENVAVETKLYPGIADAVAQLAGLGTLACVTNKPERISWRLLEVLGISKFFSAVIGGDSCPKSKPDPMVIGAAARRSGLGRSARTMMIGDSVADISMGKAYGAKTIWCAWGYAERCDEPADAVAHSPGQLPALVKAALA